MNYNLKALIAFAIFSLFIINYKSCAQASDTLRRPFEIGIEGQVGYVYKHSKKLDAVETGTPFGFQLYMARKTTGTKYWHQLYMARKTTGTKYWHQLYNYPTFGVSLTYMSLGNKNVLGDAAIGLAYMQFDISKYRRSTISWSFGTGVAYCNTVWDEKENPLNQAISSPISYSMQTQFAYNHQIDEKLKIKAGFGLTHISNGSMKKPNLGINVPIFNLALFYNPLPGKIYYTRQKLEPCKKEWRFNAAYFVSFSRLDSGTNAMYPAHVVSLYMSKKFNYRHTLLLGMDGIYDTSIRKDIERQKGWGQHPKEIVERVLVTVGHELTISQRFSYSTQFGVYVYKPFKSKSWAYQRLNIKYYFNKNMFVGTSLRTHFGTADGLEIGAGFKI